ncbi:hypothetical protein AArcSl_0124 [Halalkaliarchaeum desulfuricum]|uniref:DZANK-type domain-containing protein n=1 Tax=Halalkaliarchaeum desulfuricum TaxID=2055893 RepID=A0A343TFA9_9EURY|nr:zinc ribbon domain-containing protein [Halalkaliarchaeum desulfuricum]AUX07781.1 hypothetical protein AArcSl_0124 [Halalkaliarchaeum desulfuricum]
MSLRTALLAVGILVVGYVLFVTVLAMGPLGWIVVGTMLLIGMIQVYRKRRGLNRDGETPPRFCANCGAELAPEFGEGDVEGEDSEFGVNYCSSCGAPVPSAADTATEKRRCNCPDCGARNDADRSECDYCGAVL